MDKLCTICDNHLNILSDLNVIDTKILLKIKQDIEAIVGQFDINWEVVDERLNQASFDRPFIEKNLEKLKCSKKLSIVMQQDLIFSIFIEFLANKPLSKIQHDLLRNYHKVIRNKFSI